MVVDAAEQRAGVEASSFQVGLHRAHRAHVSLLAPRYADPSPTPLLVRLGAPRVDDDARPRDRQVLTFRPTSSLRRKPAAKPTKSSGRSRRSSTSAGALPCWSVPCVRRMPAHTTAPWRTSSGTRARRSCAPGRPPTGAAAGRGLQRARQVGQVQRDGLTRPWQRLHAVLGAPVREVTPVRGTGADGVGCFRCRHGVARLLGDELEASDGSACRRSVAA